MKTIVIYQSKTDHTKRYAQWIAEALSCEAKELKHVTKEEVAAFDKVIFGGWIMGGMIMGLDKMKKLMPKDMVVFGVGATLDDGTMAAKIKEENKIAYPVYYFVGGLDMDKLGFVQRSMVKMVQKSVAKKENKTEEDLLLEKSFSDTSDHSKREYIDELVAYCVK